jgi:hypothetical protein
MNIGFDLDNVFIDTPPFFSKELIERLYKKRDNRILEYRIPSYPERMIRKASHLPFLRPPIKSNLDFLRSIAKDGNRLYLISSRFKFLEKETSRIIKRYELDKTFEKMYFNYENKQPHIFKDEIIKHLDLDIYVDDDASLLRFVSGHNNRTKFFLLHPWRKYPKTDGNIISIAKLPEIFNKS